MEDLRQQFEKWIFSAPFEKSIARFPDDDTKFSWPGSYRDLAVELAWQAWQEASKQVAEHGKRTITLSDPQPAKPRTLTEAEIAEIEEAAG